MQIYVKCYNILVLQLQYLQYFWKIGMESSDST